MSDRIKGSPSTRRAWIEMESTSEYAEEPETSPSTRRAWIEIHILCTMHTVKPVALHPEGVDRNHRLPKVARVVLAVALHPEGVDRNTNEYAASYFGSVALHPEGAVCE